MGERHRTASLTLAFPPWHFNPGDSADMFATNVRYDSLHRYLNRLALHISRLTFTFLLAVAPAILGGCGTLSDALKPPPDPSARIVGAELQNLTFDHLNLVFDVEITNPRSVDLSLLELNYVIGSGERQLVQGEFDATATIPANGSSVIQVPARLEFAAVVRTLTGVQPGSIVPYHADIDVVVDAPLVGALHVPVRYEGEIPIPAVPEISVVSFDTGSMTWEVIDATAKLRVTNTNQFQIDLDKFNFDLTLGKETLASIGMRSTSRLAPGQSVIVEIPVSFSPRAFADSIAGIFDVLSGNETGYKIFGNLDIGTRFGPLSAPFGNTDENFIKR